MELLRRLASVPPDDQATTSITVGEMVFGALRTSRSEDLLRRIETTALANLTILSFDYEAAAQLAAVVFAWAEAAISAYCASQCMHTKCDDDGG